MATLQNFDLKPCLPPFWAPEKHSQTIFGDILPSAKLKDPGQTWIIDLPDGDQTAHHLHLGNSDWVIVLLHGLAGSADSKYIHRMTQLFQQDHHTVVRANHRNCGMSFGLAKHPYHSGRSDDIAVLIKKIRQRFTNKKILTVGYSMSANSVLLLMSKVFPMQNIFNLEDFASSGLDDQFELPDAAITVNAPINLAKSAFEISNKLNRIYELNFMFNLHFFVQGLAKKGQIESQKGLHPFMKVTNFDQLFTAPRAGFLSASNYYELCSAGPHLTKIDRPTVCLTSANDPFIPVSDYLKLEASPFLRLHIENHGGHLGYLQNEKTPLGTNRWLDYGVYEISKKLFDQVGD
ncbi:MAG: YheT family hydrolase [Pseudobdellovibrionaceae bacterium]